MMAYRLCLLLALGVVLAASAVAVTAANTDIEVQNVAGAALEGLNKLLRTKRESGLFGSIRNFIGKILRNTADMLTSIRNYIDIQIRTVINYIAKWANHYNGNDSNIWDSIPYFG